VLITTLKLIDKSKIIDGIQRERVDREIAILKACNHPNIVKLIDTYESDEEISLVMELYVQFFSLLLGEMKE
jgi:serine/threonine protein kinase